MTGTSANSTAIKLLASFDLTSDDVNRHPGSVLHTLMNSVDTADDGVPELNLTKILSNTQLSTFTYAVPFTVALHRHDCLPVDLLEFAAKSYSVPSLLDKLQQLLEFLNLSGPVSKYLPAPRNSITLQPLHLLDLHREAAARHAVDLMLGSVFSSSSSSSSTGSNNRSLFCVFVKDSKEVISPYELVVYSLKGAGLQNMPKMCHVMGVDLTSSDPFSAVTGRDRLRAVPLPEGTGSTSINGWDLQYQDSTDANRMSHFSVSPTSHKLLLERISEILHSTVTQMQLRGDKGHPCRRR